MGSWIKVTSHLVRGSPDGKTSVNQASPVTPGLEARCSFPHEEKVAPFVTRIANIGIFRFIRRVGHNKGS